MYAASVNSGMETERIRVFPQLFPLFSTSSLSPHGGQRPYRSSFTPAQRDTLMLKPCVVSGGRVGRQCDACGFMRADKHGRDGLSGASGRSPESSVLKQCWCWGARGTRWLAMGNTCAGVRRRAVSVGGWGEEEEGRKRGSCKGHCIPAIWC